MDANRRVAAGFVSLLGSFADSSGLDDRNSLDGEEGNEAEHGQDGEAGPEADDSCAAVSVERVPPG